MQNRILIDLLGTFLVYGIYAVAIYLIFREDLLTSGQFALTMLGISLLCFLAWYAIGEWGIKPYAPVGTWLGVWACLLLVVVASAIAITFYFDAVNAEPGLHFGGGIGAFYLTSVLFSPAGGKFLIWPAKSIRTW
jgi:hypothetical protein